MTGAGTSADGRVVVGVDGSEPSVVAAVVAAEFAGRRGAGLLVAHVTPWRSAGDALPMAARETRERFEESATLLVEAAAETVRRTTGLSDVTATVVDDYPVDGLLALSADATLLVIGRRGSTGVPGLLLGSTAGAVVQHAQCPVLTLPDDVDEPAADPGTVVAAVEGRPGDEEVLAFAVEEAAARGGAVTAVHAWRDPAVEAALGGFGPLVDWNAVAEDEQRQLAEAVAGWRTAAPDVPMHEVVVRGRPAPALLSASAGAGLLVVGHRHRGRLARLGSTTHGVLHRAPCATVVVPIRA